MALDTKLKDLLWKTLQDLGEDDFQAFKFHTHLPQSVQEHANREKIVDQLEKTHGENAPDETIKILKKIGNNNLAKMLDSGMLEIKGTVFSIDDDELIARLKADLQDNLQSLYSFVPEGNAERCEQQPLADVYTELYVTYGADVSPDERHEVLQMETRAAAKKSIQPCDIFKSADGKPRPIRTLLTVGFAGIGKTFLVRKFALEWARGNTNRDLHFIFPLTFRELNMDKEKSFTLAQLIRRYVSESRHMSEETLNKIFASLQSSGKQDYESSRIKILFVLDGLDECSFKMQLENVTKVDIDVKEAYPLEVLLAHLVKRNLLPCARVWITTRPATVRNIPSDLIDSRTEVRGFSDSQRLAYFRKRFPNEERVIKHIEKSRTIFIMCHLPIFCWLTATVLQDHLDNGKEGELPKTLTDMYTYFVLYHFLKSKEKLNMEIIHYVKALAKLAFHHTMKKSQIFYEKDLVDSGFDYCQAHCGLFTEVFKEVHPLRRNLQGKMFQFVHLTIQEYLAALYVMMCFFQDNKNILDDSGWKEYFIPFMPKTITEVHQSALHKASQSEGNLDLFLRFLFGISLQCNQELVGELLKAPKDFGQSKSDTVELLKKTIKRNTPEKNINLFYCLNELKDDSLLKQIQQELRSGRLSWRDMPNDMWSALAFFLLTDDETMNSFDLKKYSASAAGLEMLLSVVKASQKSLLNECHLDKSSCHLLACLLRSPSNLRHLDLSLNDLSDEGVEILSKGLASPNCILKVLRLQWCQITKRGCVSLAEALKINPSHLQELALSGNDLFDEGVEILSKGLASPDCILKVLELGHCGMTKRGCISLAEALTLKLSHLQELHLSGNDLSDVDEGIEILSRGLARPDCMLKVLRLQSCRITKRGCFSLAKALKLNPSYLQELALGGNGLWHEGVEMLSEGIACPDSILRVLELRHCGITTQGCISLAEALKLKLSHLQELDLSDNDLSEKGVEILLKGLGCSDCILEVLRLSGCKITKRGCVSLAEALKLKLPHLQELDLSENNLTDEGVQILSKGLASSHCILKFLRLTGCKITKRGCPSLAEALKLKLCRLQELNLSYNDLSDEGVEILSKIIANPVCILKVLRMSNCGITEKGFISLTEALNLKLSHLQELDLSGNGQLEKGVEILLKGLARPDCILKVLRLSQCKITDEVCVSLAKALKLKPSHLEKLHLNFSNLSDEGLDIFSEGLASTNCLLKVLELQCCGITKRGCVSLAKALKLNLSHLQVLDLSDNDLFDDGVKSLFQGLASPDCILKVLRLSDCKITKRVCYSLAMAFEINPSHLQELDLSYNCLSDYGVNKLSKGLARPDCILKVLSLSGCKITKRGFISLAKALRLQLSHLQELDLNLNNLSDADEEVEILSKGLASPDCILKVLGLSRCMIMEKGCVSLAQALKINLSHLQKLDLSYNDLSDEGVKILSQGLGNPDCILKVLKLSQCKITKQGCVSLAEALKLNPSHLQKLDVGNNNLLDDGVEILLNGLTSSNCILKVLNLSHCMIMEKGCVSLAEALKVNPSHLQKLDLSYNDLSDEGVEILSKGLASSHCILKVLKLSQCKITEKGYVALAEALKLNPSYLQKLDVTDNDLSDNGVKTLLKGLASPHCILQVLELSWCKITEKGFVSLAEAFNFHPFIFQILQNLTDKEVRTTFDTLPSQYSVGIVLTLSWGRITEKGCVLLAQDVKSNPSHLQKLVLFSNDSGKAGKRVLKDAQRDPSHKVFSTCYTPEGHLTPGMKLDVVVTHVGP
ncbi:NLR family CARD domain-containing protein 3-like isoform X2 [Corythoichthys intestinalis]|uniref:NLR family CARD domain-containing protein 3-like isoform X2 n=1 Tax=Corythoichthys intestinalis TaxID=161448 RepID=UPI0025A5686A|nr:NLR family CARD domain-containing protein 3-like isoform X2 [Corythoichthys intestinalis]